MKNILSQLRRCQLFTNIEDGNLETMLNCLSAKKTSYVKGEFIFSADDPVNSVGIVLAGSVHIINEDYWGNRSILTQLAAGELFAEAFSCAKVERLPVSVIAVEPVDALLLDYRRIITTCSSFCAFHTRLIENMLRIIAQKNVALMEKMEHITKRKTREKLLSYLSKQAKRSGGNKFDIPFNRQEMADYLSVERSALSYELSKLKAQGKLNYRKNHFELSQAAD